MSSNASEIPAINKQENLDFYLKTMNENNSIQKQDLENKINFLK